jgi:hypothetical protein
MAKSRFTVTVIETLTLYFAPIEIEAENSDIAAGIAEGLAMRGHLDEERQRSEYVTAVEPAWPPAA